MIILSRLPTWVVDNPAVFDRRLFSRRELLTSYHFLSTAIIILRTPCLIQSSFHVSKYKKILLIGIFVPVSIIPPAKSVQYLNEANYRNNDLQTPVIIHKSGLLDRVFLREEQDLPGISNTIIQEQKFSLKTGATFSTNLPNPCQSNCIYNY